MFIFFLFKMRYRNRAMAEENTNDGDAKINESLVLKTLMSSVRHIPYLHNATCFLLTLGSGKP